MTFTSHEHLGYTDPHFRALVAQAMSSLVSNRIKVNPERVTAWLIETQCFACLRYHCLTLGSKCSGGHTHLEECPGVLTAAVRSTIRKRRAEAKALRN